MAVTRGKSPVLLTANGDTLTPSGEKLEWKVTSIRVVNGSNAGDVVLLDRSGGSEIFRSNSLGANDVDGTVFGEHVWMDDVYVSSIPTGCKVYVYYR